MKFGAGNLAERKQAAVDRHKLFAARLTSRRIDTIRAFGVDERNNAEGRARMTRRWRDGDWGSSKDLDPVAFSRNSTMCVRNPAKPVIHAAFAYWAAVLHTWRSGASNEADAERGVLHNREVFGQMRAFAAQCREIALSIPELRAKEDNPIRFEAD